jgi:predicted ATPase
LLAALLSLPRPESIPPLTLSPQKQKQKTQEALVAWIVEEAEKAAVYCVWEDLHWADPSTLEVLTLFLEQIPTTRVFTVLTFRPDFTLPWSPRSYLTPLMLSRLRHAQAEEMVTRVTSGKVLPPEVLGQVVSKTDGVPLFVEELTKMVVESGLVREANGHYELVGPLPPLAIPSTLQDSLMARLDRLATGKEVAQLGAAVGREFSYELLQAVAPVEEASLQQALTKLVEAEVLYQRGLPPQARYVFKHALIQDAAYQSLLKSTRQQYHQQIARVLEGQFPETKETQPELLAHHYTEASLIAQAVPYWQRAGQWAAQRSAYVEAVSYLTKGLELLKTLPDTSERAQQELRLQTALGTPLIATKGFAAPEVKRIHARARELCRQIGETPQLFPVLGGLCAFYKERAELQTAQELAEQLLRLAQNVRDSGLLLWAHLALGNNLVLQGEVVAARAHLEQGIALYDPDKHNSRGYVLDPGVSGLHVLAQVLLVLGYPDQALKRSHEALALARKLAHPFSLARTLTSTAGVHLMRGEYQAAQELNEAGIALASEQGFPDWMAWGTFWRGWALAEQGQGEEGITQMRCGITAYRAIGVELGEPFRLTQLARAYGNVGQVREGFALLAEALALVDKTGERIAESWLYQLKGELLLKQVKGQGPESGVQKEAEACFRQAIEIARRQSAKLSELKAAMSLARLWQQQGKKDEARQMLAEVYNWFTEGFDTKDLQEAKALLEGVSRTLD